MTVNQFKIMEKENRKDLDNKVAVNKLLTKALLKQENANDYKSPPMIIPKNSAIGKTNALDMKTLDNKIKVNELLYRAFTNQPLNIKEEKTADSMPQEEEEENLDEILNGYQVPVNEPEYEEPKLKKEIEINEDEDAIVNTIEALKGNIDSLEEQRKKVLKDINTIGANKLLATSNDMLETLQKLLVERTNLFNSLNEQIKVARNKLTNYERNYFNVKELHRTNEQIRNDNEASIVGTENMNIQKLKDYEDAIKKANKVKYNLQPLPNETKEEYAERIRRDIELNKGAHIDRYLAKVNDSFKNRLFSLVKNLSTTLDVMNSLRTDAKHFIVQHFELYKSEFIKLFGETNKQLTTQAILNFTETFLSKVGRDYQFKKIKESTPVRTPLKMKESSTIRTPLKTKLKPPSTIYDLDDFRNDDDEIVQAVRERQKR